MQCLIEEEPVVEEHPIQSKVEGRGVPALLLVNVLLDLGEHLHHALQLQLSQEPPVSLAPSPTGGTSLEEDQDLLLGPMVLLQTRQTQIGLLAELLIERDVRRILPICGRSVTNRLISWGEDPPT